MAETAPIDANDSKGLTAASSADGKTPIRVWADPVSHRLLVDSLGGTIVGPGSSTDNAIVRWDGTNGTTIQDSPILIQDSGKVIFGNGFLFDDTQGTVQLNSGNESNGAISLGIPVVPSVGSSYSDFNIYANVVVGTNNMIVGNPASNLSVAGNATITGNISATNGNFSGNVTTTGTTDSASYSAGGTAPVADGTYTVGIGVMTNGTITTKGGIITAVQEAS